MIVDFRSKIDPVRMKDKLGQVLEKPSGVMAGYYSTTQVLGQSLNGNLHYLMDII